jgi:hypothetical protein
MSETEEEGGEAMAFKVAEARRRQDDNFSEPLLQTHPISDTIRTKPYTIYPNRLWSRMKRYKNFTSMTGYPDFVPMLG